MKKNLIDRRALPIVLGITVVATAVAVASMAAVPARSHSQPGPPPDAVLTWNTYAVNAVRASTPTKFQTDGMVYMAYVQAAVYDAVTKIDGKYEPYHDFAFTPAPGASVQAAVAAAARTVLEQLPAGSAADGRRGIQRLSRHAERGCRGRRCRRQRGGKRPDRVQDRRRAQGPDPGLRTDRSDYPGQVAAAVADARQPRRRGSPRCDRSCSTARRSSLGLHRRRRSRATGTRTTSTRPRAYGAVNSSQADQ